MPFVVFADIKKTVSIKDILDHYRIVNSFIHNNGGAIHWTLYKS